MANNERRGEAEELITVMEEENMDLVEEDRVLMRTLSGLVWSRTSDRIKLTNCPPLWTVTLSTEIMKNVEFEKTEIFSRGDVKIWKSKRKV